MTCQGPLTLPALVDYWLGELPPAAEDEVENHFFACASCAASLEGLYLLFRGVRALARAGALHAVVPGSVVERLARDGVRIHTFHVRPGETVPCAVAPEDDLLVARLSADLSGAERVDFVICDETWRERARLADIPVDRRRAEVVVAERVDRARGFPAHVFRMRVVSAGPGGERVLGEYALSHAPFRP